MKSIKYLSKIMALAAVAIACTLPAKAQMSDNAYGNIDWQFNFPLNNGYADKGSGWGMNFEGGYYLTDEISLGGFMAFHSNHEYIPRKTLSLSNGGSFTTDQQHTLFQLPFGVVARYTFDRSKVFQPYVGVKVGPQYAQLRSDFNAYTATKNTWGFYASPEVGFNIYPWAYGPGIHMAVYYGYATNSGKILVYHVDGMSNIGLRLGIAF